MGTGNREQQGTGMRQTGIIGTGKGTGTGWGVCDGAEDSYGQGCSEGTSRRGTEQQHGSGGLGTPWAGGRWGWRDQWGQWGQLSPDQPAPAPPGAPRPSQDPQSLLRERAGSPRPHFPLPPWDTLGPPTPVTVSSRSCIPVPAAPLQGASAQDPCGDIPVTKGIGEGDIPGHHLPSRYLPPWHLPFCHLPIQLVWTRNSGFPTRASPLQRPSISPTGLSFPRENPSFNPNAFARRAELVGTPVETLMIPP